MRRHCHHAGGRRLLRRQRRATAAAGPGNPGATSPKVCSRRPQPALAAAAGLTAIRRRSSGRALPLKLFGALTRRSTATRQRRAPATPGPPRQRHFRGAPGACWPMRRAWRRAGASAAGTRHWHLDEAREKKRWLRAKIPEIDNSSGLEAYSEADHGPAERCAGAGAGTGCRSFYWRPGFACWTARALPAFSRSPTHRARCQ